MFKRKNMLLIMVLILALSIFVVGCSKDSEPSNGDGNGQETPDTSEPSDDVKAGPAIDKDTVVVATANETPSLTVAGHNAVAGTYMNRLTHNGLFRLDEDLLPVPELLAEFEVEEDENGEETIWVMTLHEGIKFHDGSDLTSEDVIASLEFAKEHPEVSMYTKTVVDTEIVDDLTFKLFTDGPSASLQYDLAHHANYIVPKELIDSGNDFNENPIGAGAYKFVEWVRGEQLTFTAHEDYFNPDRAPKIKNVIWKIIPEGSSRSIALEAGEIDYIIELDTTSLDSFKANSNIAVLEVPSISHNWLTINNEKAPFDNKDVRKAISSAINREDVITVALNGSGVVATGQTPEGMLGFSGEGFDSYDPEKAKAHMEAWGGDPASIELDIICSDDTKRRAAEVIQANLAEIGIDATISSMDLATYLSETAEGNFTGFIGGYTAVEMLQFLKGVHHSSSINASNKTRTNIAELDALIDEAARTIDQEERRVILEKASELLNEEAPQAPLYQNNIVSAHKANLENTGLTASGKFRVQEWSWK